MKLRHVPVLLLVGAVRLVGYCVLSKLKRKAETHG